LTCKEFTSFIVTYLADELPRDIRGAFDHHLSLCPNCVRYLAQYRHTIDLERFAFAEPNETVPPTVPPELLEAILAAKRDVAGH
jgi:anti-sigma factor RsiW